MHAYTDTHTHTPEPPQAAPTSPSHFPTSEPRPATGPVLKGALEPESREVTPRFGECQLRVLSDAPPIPIPVPVPIRAASQGPRRGRTGGQRAGARWGAGPGHCPVPPESCLVLAPRTSRGAGSAWNVPVLTTDRLGGGAGAWQTQPHISGQKQGEISVLGACPQGPGQTFLLQREGFWRTGPASRGSQAEGGVAPRGQGPVVRPVVRPAHPSCRCQQALLTPPPGCPQQFPCAVFKLLTFLKCQGAFLSLPTMPSGDAGLAQGGGTFCTVGHAGHLLGLRQSWSQRASVQQRRSGAGGWPEVPPRGRFAPAAQPWGGGNRSRSSPQDRPRPPTVPTCLETPICPQAPAACCW